jgi:hypothetical protein
MASDLVTCLSSNPSHQVRQIISAEVNDLPAHFTHKQMLMPLSSAQVHIAASLLVNPLHQA